MCDHIVQHWQGCMRSDVVSLELVETQVAAMLERSTAYIVEKYPRMGGPAE